MGGGHAARASEAGGGSGPEGVCTEGQRKPVPLFVGVARPVGDSPVHNWQVMALPWRTAPTTPCGLKDLDWRYSPA